MSSIQAGFKDYVHDAQRCFRQVLKALSEPGSKVELFNHLGFTPLNPVVSQVMLTLCDSHTGIYLSPSLAIKNNDTEEAIVNLAFHNGVPCAPLNKADFIVVSAHQAIDFSQCKAGSDSRPEQSATILVQIDSFTQGPKFRISGPGIEFPIEVQLGNLSDSFIAYLCKPTNSYPLGLDFMFCTQHALLAISRTTKLELI